MASSATDLGRCDTNNDAHFQARECVREAAAVLYEFAPDATALVLDPGPEPATAGATVRLVRVLSDVGTCLLAEPAASSMRDLVELHLNEALSYVPVAVLAPQRSGRGRCRVLALPGDS